MLEPQMIFPTTLEMLARAAGALSEPRNKSVFKFPDRIELKTPNEEPYGLLIWDNNTYRFVPRDSYFEFPKNPIKAIRTPDGLFYHYEDESPQEVKAIRTSDGRYYKMEDVSFVTLAEYERDLGSDELQQEFVDGARVAAEIYARGENGMGQLKPLSERIKEAEAAVRAGWRKTVAEVVVDRDYYLKNGITPS